MLCQEREIVKQAIGFFRQGWKSMRSKLIGAAKKEFPVDHLCEVLGVSHNAVRVVLGGQTIWCAGSRDCPLGAAPPCRETAASAAIHLLRLFRRARSFAGVAALRGRLGMASVFVAVAALISLLGFFCAAKRVELPLPVMAVSGE